MSRMILVTSFAALAWGAAGAAETRTVELLNAATMSAWQLPSEKWEVGGDVFLHPEKPNLLAWKPGQGAIVNGDDGRTSNIHSKIEHGDCEAHVEFMVPQGSNSGVYFQGRYEIQVFDSWDSAAKKPKADPKSSDCGGIYERWGPNGGYEGRGPRVNACKAPGQWQTFDVVFRAPRFDASGKKTANACFVKVVHNGILIHENVEVTGPTRAATWENEEKPLGPLMLQGDHGPVAYRNIRITMLASDIAKAADAVLPESALPALMKYDFAKERKQEAAIELALRSAPAEVVAAVEARLLAVLAAKDATFAAKQWICRLLRVIGTEQSVPVLAALLADKELAHFARFALQHQGSAKAGDALRAALGTLEGDLKIGVVGSLGDRRDAKAVPQLAALAESKDSMLAQAAVRALGRIGTAEAAKALSGAKVAREHRALQSDSMLLCADGMLARGDAAGAAAIYRTHTESYHDPMVRLAAFRGLVMAEKEKAVPLVLELLNDKDAKLREAAYLFVGQMPGVEATKAFAAKLPALPAATRAALIAVLAGRGDKAALPAVLTALDDADEGVRVAAVGALAMLGDASAVSPLLAAAAKGGKTGEAARQTLARLPGDEVPRALVQAIQDKPDTAAVVVDVLGARRDKTAFPALRELAKKGNANAARAYVRMLDFGAEGPPEALSAIFEEAITLAPDAESKKAVLGAAGKRAGTWSIEFVEKYRADAELKAAADAAYEKIFAALNKMPLLDKEAVLKAAEAEIHGEGAAYEGGPERECIGVWTSAQAWVSWDVMVKTPGTFEVTIAQSMAGIPGGTYSVLAGDQALKGTVKDTGDWAKFEPIALGKVTIEKPGAYKVAFKPIKLAGTYLVNLRSVTLTRVQ